MRVLAWIGIALASFSAGPMMVSAAPVLALPDKPLTGLGQLFARELPYDQGAKHDIVDEHHRARPVRSPIVDVLPILGDHLASENPAGYEAARRTLAPAKRGPTDVVKKVVKPLKDLIKWIYKTITHPKNTFGKIKEVIKHPVEAMSNLKKDIKSFF